MDLQVGGVDEIEMRLAVALGLAAAGLALAAPGASAFDCKRAASLSEKAICADPAALAADADLSKAFEALRAGDDPKARAQLVAAEVVWLARRDARCSDRQGAALSACLAAQSRARLAFLTGAPEAGPGAPGQIAPAFLMQKGGNGRADIDIQTLRFVSPASPAARAFNAAVDRLASDLEEPEKDDPQADKFVFRWSMRLAYASPRLISAHADGYSFTGGAHSNSYGVDVNVDVARGREATFDDLLDKPAAQRIFALCVDQVRDKKKEAGEWDENSDAWGPKQLVKDVAGASADLKAWSFGGDAATIGYDPYAVGPYSDGPFECKIPYAVLRPLARPDFPLP